MLQLFACLKGQRVVRSHGLDTRSRLIASNISRPKKENAKKPSGAKPMSELKKKVEKGPVSLLLGSKLTWNNQE